MDRRRDLLVFLLLALVSAVLCAYGLGDKPLAGDEATSYFMARIGWGEFWESLGSSEVNGSAFYMSLRFWSELGTSEGFLRILPVLFAVPTPLVLYRIGTRIAGYQCGIAAAILLIVNTMFVSHAQNLRSYSLSALMACIATLLLIRLIEQPSAVRAAAYAVTSAIMLYSHFFGAWVLLAHAASLLFLPRKTIPWKMLFAAGAAVALLAVPIAIFVLTQDQGQVDWIGDVTPKRIHGTLDEFTGRGDNPMLLAAGATCLVALLGLVGSLRERMRAPAGEGRAPVQWQRALVLLWLVLPVVGTLLVSIYKPLWQARYLLVSLPALSLCLALGISMLRWAPLKIAAVVGLVALTAPQLPRWYSFERDRVWARKAAVVVEQGREGDGIAFYSPTSIRSFGYYGGYYANLDEPALPQVVYPGIDWLGYSRTRYHPPVERIAAQAADFGRMWLVKGAAGDEPRKVELEELVEVLRSTCEEKESVFQGVLLFSGC